MPEYMNTSTIDKLFRAESSRINGSKSKSPVSSEGKQRSSCNRTTYGMRSSRIVLRNESQDAYDQLHSLFFQLFDPHDIFEHECVSNLVNARWRIRRLQAASAANLELALEEARPDFESRYQNLDTAHEHALAFRAIAQTAAGADIIERHEDRQHRLFERSYRLLAKHRGQHRTLPSGQAIRDAEDTLPSDNLPPRNPVETEPDTQNQAFEPETPPEPSQPLRVMPSASKSGKSKEPKEPRNPNFIYRDDPNYLALKPLFEALQDRPDLRLALSDAIAEYQAKTKPDLAA